MMPCHKKYKTEMCKNYLREKKCPYGIRCRFIHNSSGDEIIGDEQLHGNINTSLSITDDEIMSPIMLPAAGGESPMMIPYGSMDYYNVQCAQDNSATRVMSA